MSVPLLRQDNIKWTMGVAAHSKQSQIGNEMQHQYCVRFFMAAASHWLYFQSEFEAQAVLFGNLGSTVNLSEGQKW